MRVPAGMRQAAMDALPGLFLGLSTGALGDRLDVTDDGGICVRPPASAMGSREREAALGMVQLARG